MAFFEIQKGVLNTCNGVASDQTSDEILLQQLEKKAQSKQIFEDTPAIFTEIGGRFSWNRLNQS